MTFAIPARTLPENYPFSRGADGVSAGRDPRGEGDRRRIAVACGEPAQLANRAITTAFALVLFADYEMARRYYIALQWLDSFGAESDSFCELRIRQEPILFHNKEFYVPVRGAENDFVLPTRGGICRSPNTREG